eukprot:6704964-Prymnesium_polylepis.1
MERLFLGSVDAYVAGKEARGEQRAPSGPTEYERGQALKRQLSESAARALHEGRFEGNVCAALRDPEFEGASEKLTRKALDALQLRETDSDCSCEEYIPPDEEASSTTDRALAVAAKDTSLPVPRQRVSAELARLKEDSQKLLQDCPARRSSTHYDQRKQYVEVLFTDAIEIAKGSGIDLGAAERAPRAFDCSMFTPMAAALDDALHEFFEAVYTGTGKKETFRRRDADAAVKVLSERLYNSERPAEAANKQPRTVANNLLDVAATMEVAIKLVQEPPSDLKAQIQQLERVVECGLRHDDTIASVLSDMSPPAPPVTITHWDSFVRKARRVALDMKRHT